MSVKADISTRAEIEHLLKEFYNKALSDPVIGHFFTEVVPLNLEAHLPLIADFWESVLIGKRGYRKNLMEIHREIHHKSNIKAEHFDQWVKLFSETVDECFEGQSATLAKQRARSIATLMNINFNHENPLKIAP